MKELPISLSDIFVAKIQCALDVQPPMIDSVQEDHVLSLKVQTS